MQLLPEQSHPNVANALGRSVRTPLEALRIILEDLNAGTSDTSVLPAAIETLQRVRRSVESVEEYFRAERPEPLICTVREVAHGVRNYLSEEQRSSLLIALDANTDVLFVDSTMLVKSLANIAENCIEASAHPVLLRVQRQDAGFTFTIVGRSVKEFNFEEALEPFITEKRGHVGLGLTIAARNLERLGGELIVRTGSSRATRFEVFVPQCKSKVEAA